MSGKRKASNRTLVWTSDGGRQNEPDTPAAPAACGDGKVRISRETKGRRGKAVTVVTGVPLSGDALRELATELKRKCGSGGTVRDGTIEIQGDHRDTLVPLLAGRGWLVVRSGG